MQHKVHNRRQAKAAHRAAMQGDASSTRHHSHNTGTGHHAEALGRTGGKGSILKGDPNPGPNVTEPAAAVKQGDYRSPAQAAHDGLAGMGKGSVRPAEQSAAQRKRTPVRIKAAMVQGGVGIPSHQVPGYRPSK